MFTLVVGTKSGTAVQDEWINKTIIIQPKWSTHFAIASLLAVCPYLHEVKILPHSLTTRLHHLMQKCGTTSLAGHMRSHAGISGPAGLPYHEALSKETHFFEGQQNSWRGAVGASSCT